MPPARSPVRLKADSQHVLSPDKFVRQPLRFFRRGVQHSFALVRKREVYRSRNSFADQSSSLNFFANAIDRSIGFGKKAASEVLVFTKKAEEQMLRFDGGTSKLAGLISGKEYDPPRLFRIFFKHNPKPGLWLDAPRNSWTGFLVSNYYTDRVKRL